MVERKVRDPLDSFVSTQKVWCTVLLGLHVAQQKRAEGDLLNRSFYFPHSGRGDWI
jgi:hypothetical protein